MTCKSKGYTPEFKIEAVKQTNERGSSVAEVSGRLGICTKALYHWRSQLFDKQKLIKAQGLGVTILTEDAWVVLLKKHS